VALPRAPKPKPSERGPCPTTVARPPPTAVGVDGVRDIAREQGEGARREEGADPSQEVERGQRRRGVEPHPFEAGERPPGPGHPAERAQDNKTGEGRARDPDPSEPRDRAAHRRVGRRHSWPSIRAHRSLLDCPTRPDDVPERAAHAAADRAHQPSVPNLEEGGRPLPRGFHGAFATTRLLGPGRVQTRAQGVLSRHAHELEPAVDRDRGGRHHAVLQGETGMLRHVQLLELQS
jgi:hypothetical protein